MNVLLVYSSGSMGEDPVMRAIAQAFTDHHVVLGDSSDRGFKIERDPTEYDLVLTLDASRWYFRNRLAIRGQYTAYLGSFCMGDLYRILEQQESLADLGVGSVFTNCFAFSQQVNPGVPVVYLWKPMVPIARDPKAPKQFPFGTVIPNIADRDFSLVALVAKWVKANGKGVPFPIFVPDSERARLPKALEEFRVPVLPSALFACWTYIHNYIPAIRITDYRGGVVPAELIQAIMAGVPPVIIAHPIVVPLEGTVEPLYSSLTQLRAALPYGLQAKPMAKINVKPEFLPTPEHFVEQVLMTHRTRRENARKALFAKDEDGQSESSDGADTRLA